MTGKDRAYITTGAAETIALGREIAAMLRPPRLLILRGDLGTGKTTLVKGIAEGLGAAEADAVTSPTFTLIHEYVGGYGRPPVPVRLYHLDLYRIDTERQLESLGIGDLLAEEDAILLVEWGEKFPVLARRADGEILLTSTGVDTRHITLHFGEDQPPRENPD